MNSLPELAGGSVHYRLPLAEETAIRLSGVLLADSTAERTERLECALAADAPLALWAVLVAPQPIDIAAPLPGLAAWLGPRLTRLLANSSGGDNVSPVTAARANEIEPILTQGRPRSKRPLSHPTLPTQRTAITGFLVCCPKQSSGSLSVEFRALIAKPRSKRCPLG